MEIKPSQPIEAKYGDRTFSVQRPKVIFLRGFQRRMAEAQNVEGNGEAALDIMIDFCKQVGVPEDVLSDWDLYQLKEFMEFLSEAEKKT